METGRLKGKKITPCLTNDRILNIYKRRLRNEDVTVHFVTEHRSSLTYDLLVGAGIKLPKVTGEAEKIACVYEFEHGKSTLTDSVLAAAGTKVQEVAGVVQMTDTRADEAERGKSTLTDSVLAAAGTKVQEVAGDVQMTDTRADDAERGKSTLTDFVLAAAGTKVQEVAGDVQTTDTRADEAERGITKRLVTMETGRLKGKKITPCLTDDRILNIYKSRLRNEDVTVHFVTEYRSGLSYDILVGAGIKLPKVTGEAEKIACVYEYEHGKSTLTDSVLAAAGTKVQEFAGDVQMTDTRADEAERGQGYHKRGYHKRDFDSNSAKQTR